MPWVWMCQGYDVGLRNGAEWIRQAKRAGRVKREALHIDKEVGTGTEGMGVGQVS